MTGCLATTSETTFLIADTSGLVFLLLSADDYNAFALRASKRLSDSIATTIVPGGLFSEMVNVLGKKAGHGVATAAATYLLAIAPFSTSDMTDELRMQNLLKRRCFRHKVRPRQVASDTTYGTVRTCPPSRT